MPLAVTHARGFASPRVLRGAWTGFALLMVAGVLLRVVFLDRQGLWFDEGVGLIFSSCAELSGCLDRMLDTRTSERFQFIYPLLLQQWRHLFGDTEIALRGLSVLCGIAAMPLVWATAARCFGLVHANWSLAFMAFSAFSIVHAQEARPYTLFLLFAAAQVWLYVSARQGSDVARAGLYLVTAAASWVGLFPMLFSVALALADLADRRRAPGLVARIRWWLPAGLLCVPAVAYYAIAAGEALPSQLTVPRSDAPWLNFAFVLYGQLVGQTFGPPVEALRGAGRQAALLGNLHWLALLAAVIALGAVRAVRVHRDALGGTAAAETRVLLLALLFYLGLSLVFALLTRHNWLPRHAVALHPLIALLLPLLAGGRRIVGRLRFGEATLAALLALNAVAVARHYFDRAHWKDDYRGVAAYLREVGEPRRPVLVLRGLPVLLDYYGYGRFSTAADPPAGRVAGLVRAAAEGRPEIVIVVNREADLWPPGWLDETLAAQFRRTATRQLPYFSVYIYAER